MYDAITVHLYDVDMVPRKAVTKLWTSSVSAGSFKEGAGNFITGLLKCYKLWKSAMTLKSRVVVHDIYKVPRASITNFKKQSHSGLILTTASADKFW